MNGGSRLAAELVAALDDEALDQLAEQLAPRLALRIVPDAMHDRRLEHRGFMTAAEVAVRARLHLQTVYRHLRSGRLRGDRAGSGWRITPEAFEEYVAVEQPAQTRGTSASRARLATKGRSPLRALLDAEKEA